MRFFALDFETFFDNDYTLKKMSTEEYIRDPRFEALLLGVREFNTNGEGNYFWAPQEQIPAIFRHLETLGDVAVLCHHAQFDGLIMSHHYGYWPKMWLDTMSMSRFALGVNVSASLANLARHFGLPDKSVPYDLFKGRRWINIDEPLRQQLGAGAIQDTLLNVEVFNRLAPMLPAEEFAIIDSTVRMFTEPMLVGDTEYLEKYQHDEWSRKNETLLELGVSASDLQSADKFCDILEANGVEIEYKAGKNGEIPAIAKTDEFMKGLIDHENPIVADIAQCRLDIKSTIGETRAGRLAGMARRGPMCVYLSYSGAHTKRDSGGDGCNWQNFPRQRFNEDGTKRPHLKHGIVAPKGWLLADPDSSQIECRMVNAVAGQEDVIDRFRRKEDPYTPIASEFYGVEVTKADKERRQLGKGVELSSGYGIGPPTLKAKLAAGISGSPPIRVSEEDAARCVSIYRRTHQNVVAYWATANRMIAALAGTDKPVEWGPLLVETGRLRLPNGGYLFYPDLQFEDGAGYNGSKGWRYKTKRGRRKLYGGALTENICQALARIVTFTAQVRIQKQAPHLKLVNREHDKLVFLVPDDQHAQATLAWMIEQMCVPPPWLPNIPLAAEGELSERYE